MDGTRIGERERAAEVTKKKRGDIANNGNERNKMTTRATHQEEQTTEPSEREGPKGLHLDIKGQ